MIPFPYRIAAIFVLLSSVLLSSPARGAALGEQMAQGWDHFYNLEFSAATRIFENAAAANPASPLPRNGIAQSVLYGEMYRDGSLSSELVDGHNSFLRRPKMEASPALQQQFLSSIDKSIQLSDTLLARNPRDVDALHAKAVALALRSNWNFLVHKAWHDSLSDATASRKLEDQILAIDPKDIDAKLGQGVHEYIVGDLPWQWRTLGFLVGFHGDKVRGLATVEQVAKNGNRNKADAEIILCVLYRRERASRKALPLLADLIKRYPRNYLLRLEQARMYDDLGDNGTAFKILDQIEREREQKVPDVANCPLEKIYYERATFLFWMGRIDEAQTNFQKVIAQPQDLDLNTGVISYLRLGQIQDLRKQHVAATPFYQKATEYAPESETAKEARHFIDSPYHRPKRTYGP